MVAASFAIGASAAFYQSTVHTVPPLLVRAPDLQRINATVFVLSNASVVVGPAIAGALWSRVGSSATFEVSAATGLLSAVAFLGVRTSPSGAAGSAGRPGAVRLAVEGLMYVWRSPIVRPLLALWFLVFIATGSLAELLVYRLNAELRAPATTAGFVLAAAATGAVVGPALMGARRRRMRTSAGAVPSLAVVFMAAPAVGVTYLAMSLLNEPVGLAVLAAIAQGLIAAGVVRSITVVQTTTPDVLLGRVTSIALAAEQAAVMLGLVLMGVLTAVGGTSLTLEVFGAMLLIGGGSSALAMARSQTAPKHANERVLPTAVPSEMGDSTHCNNPSDFGTLAPGERITPSGRI